MFKKIIVSITIAFVSITGYANNLIYKYKDNKGKTIYADKVPPQEKGQIVILSSRSGTIKKVVEEELSEKDIIVRNEKIVEDKKIIENNNLQKKKDISLLSSYSNVEEIEQMRQYELSQIEQGLNNNIENIANLKEKLSVLNTNIQNSPNNKNIQSEYDKVKEQLQLTEKTLENNKTMYSQREKKYNEDKNRYLEILKQMSLESKLKVE